MELAVTLAPLSGYAANTCTLAESDIAARLRIAQELHPNRLPELAPEAEQIVTWYDGVVSLENGEGLQRYFHTETGKQAQKPKKAALAQTDLTSLQAPDGRAKITRKDGNIFLHRTAQSKPIQLTHDASPDVVYGAYPFGTSDWAQSTRDRTQLSPLVYWSPTSDAVAIVRLNLKDVRRLDFLTLSNADDTHRIPKSVSAPIALPTDDVVPTASVLVFDVASGKQLRNDLPDLPMAYGPWPQGGLVWSAGGEALFVGEEARDFTALTVWRFDPKTETTRRLLKEDVAPETLRPPHVSSESENPKDGAAFYPFNDSDEIIIYSAESGRGHLYLHDGKTGKRKKALTSGDWSVIPAGMGRLYIDHESETVFFVGMGREKSEDPYFRKLYALDIRSGSLNLLTPEAADHEVSLSIENGAFVSTFSSTAKAPRTVLRRLDGETVGVLAQADLSKLKALGWTAPKRFSIKSADGKHDMWGTYHAPWNAQPGACHPLIDIIYAGPQSLMAWPGMFGFSGDTSYMMNALGFGVMYLDARGTPYREREFSNATFGEYFGNQLVADDHAKAALHLANREPSLDASRIGVWGESWGGYYAARFLAQAPDVFKAAIAESGSHDNFLYSFDHNRWFGSPERFPKTYIKQSNLGVAEAIKGDLLLIHGGDDSDVSPMNALLLAKALAAQNTYFEMLLLPDKDHGDIGSDGYVLKRRLDFFLRHFQGVSLPQDFALDDID